MMFVSLYPRDNLPPILVLGANNARWGMLAPIASITRAARDARLGDYIPIAMPTFLKLREQDESLRRALASGAEYALVADARRQATSAVREDSTFLGGTHELGLALRPLSWTEVKPCYLYHGMMDYRTVVDWPQAEYDKYHSTFV
jgi:hypothetical protein